MNCIKRLILICENCGEKMFDEINVNYEGDLLLMKVGTCACLSTKKLPPEVYKDFEQGQPFTDEL